MERLNKVRQLLEERQLDGLLLDAPIDLYYLTGQSLSLGRLLVTREESFLFVDGRYYERCREAGIDACLANREYIEGKGALQEYVPVGRVGFDADFTSFTRYEALAAWEGTLVPLYSPIRALRAIKDAPEIESLRLAAALGCRGYDFLCDQLRVGVTEKELAASLEMFWQQHGGEKGAFPAHIAFGSHTAHPHHAPTNRPLQRGDGVVMDLGVVYQKYHSDMTRTFMFGGTSSALSPLYRVVYEAFHKALEMCRPGVPVSAVDQAARSWIADQGYGKYFVHSLGHGVGLEIHEAPFLRKGQEEVLLPGMVLTIEPGIYIPGVGGVRLEDMVVITPKGYENLTRHPHPPEMPLLHRG